MNIAATELRETAFTPDPLLPQRYLRACPAYAETPLLQLNSGSGQRVWIKDESRRMGLGAFKALGGVYAVARLIAERWQERFGETLEPADFVTAAVRDFAGRLTFVCASAGNHGLAVAAGARIFGARSRIHLAETVPISFEQRLRDKAAEVVRSGTTYEESVAAAIADAKATGAILLADGSWPGYTHPPSLVMEGYTVIAEELRRQLAAQSRWPSHVFLQAGVGGLAAAMAQMIRTNWPVQPQIVVVEPDAAPCLQRSHRAGRPVRVEGPISSMGRLDCKEPSVVAFDVLEGAGVTYTTVTDEEADTAARHLSALGLATTASGAAGLAALWQFEQKQHPDPDFRPLIIVTETALN